jgi:DNA-binding protein HU-beta
MATKPKTTTTKAVKPTIITKKTLGERIQLKLVSKKIALTKSQTEAVLTEYLEETKQALIKGEEIRLPGYFSLKTAITKPRVAMNLQTKQKMNVPAKRVPKVKFSSDLKEAIAKKK